MQTPQQALALLLALLLALSTFQGGMAPAPAETPDIASLAAGAPVDPAAVDAQKLSAWFQSYEIQPGSAVYQRIYGKSYVDNPDVALADLRYCKVLHYNFDHRPQVGELIVAADLADTFLAIFQTLYKNEYEIYSMYLIDDFWAGSGDASDSASIEANNTSAFCYRTASGSGNLSRHALGRAIDVNPQQNPYVSYLSGSASYSHANAAAYIDRTTGYAHVITHQDLCYQTFAAYGFAWGGDWYEPLDYQHFSMP